MGKGGSFCRIKYSYSYSYSASTRAKRWTTSNSGTRTKRWRTSGQINVANSSSIRLTVRTGTGLVPACAPQKSFPPPVSSSSHCTGISSNLFHSKEPKDRRFALLRRIFARASRIWYTCLTVTPIASTTKTASWQHFRGNRRRKRRSVPSRRLAYSRSRSNFHASIIQTQVYQISKLQKAYTYILGLKAKNLCILCLLKFWNYSKHIQKPFRLTPEMVSIWIIQRFLKDKVEIFLGGSAAKNSVFLSFSLFFISTIIDQLEHEASWGLGGQNSEIFSFFQLLCI